MEFKEDYIYIKEFNIYNKFQDYMDWAVKGNNLVGATFFH